jgi:hypothetical protein
LQALVGEHPPATRPGILLPKYIPRAIAVNTAVSGVLREEEKDLTRAAGIWLLANLQPSPYRLFTN